MPMCRHSFWRTTQGGSASQFVPAFAVALITLLVGVLLGFPPVALGVLTGFSVATGPAFADMGYDLKAGFVLRGRGVDPVFEAAGRYEQLVAALVAFAVALVVVALSWSGYFAAGLVPPVAKVYVATIRAGVAPEVAPSLLLWALPGALLQLAGGPRRQMGVLDTQESQLRAEYKAKRAVLDLARINLGYTRIVAPIDGMVGERGVRAGQYVHEGTQVISVIPLQNVWVVANYKETQLTRVEPGQPAQIRVDAFPGVVIAGHVERIAPASGSQFSLLPPDNATGNFTKVVQRIPVKIRLDTPNPLDGKLRPGMSVVATVEVGNPPAAP